MTSRTDRFCRTIAFKLSGEESVQYIIPLEAVCMLADKREMNVDIADACVQNEDRVMQLRCIKKKTVLCLKSH